MSSDNAVRQYIEVSLSVSPYAYLKKNESPDKVKCLLILARYFRAFRLKVLQAHQDLGLSLCIALKNDDDCCRLVGRPGREGGREE